MNTTTKKIAALLAVIMLLTSCAMLVSCGNGSTENNDTNNTDQALPASEGLAYEVNDDGTCTITGIGTCKDTEIVIPQMIEGHRVSAVAEGAFKNAVVDYAPYADGEGAEPEQNEEQSPPTARALPVSAICWAAASSSSASATSFAVSALRRSVCRKAS